MSNYKDEYLEISKEINKLEAYRDKLENEEVFDDKIYKDLDRLQNRKEELEELMLSEDRY